MQRENNEPVLLYYSILKSVSRAMFQGACNLESRTRRRVSLWTALDSSKAIAERGRRCVCAMIRMIRMFIRKEKNV